MQTFAQVALLLMAAGGLGCIFLGLFGHERPEYNPYNGGPRRSPAPKRRVWRARAKKR